MNTGYHHHNLKVKILNEALAILKKQGIKSLTFRNLAKNLSVSHTAPLRHFKNKTDLLAEIAVSGFELLTRQYCARAVGIKHPLQRLRIFGREYIEFALKHREYYRVMFIQPELHDLALPQLQKAIQKNISIIIHIIRQGQEKQIIKPGHPLQLALSCWSMVHGFTQIILDQRIQFLKLYQPEINCRQLAQKLFNDLSAGLIIDQKQTNSQLD